MCWLLRSTPCDANVVLLGFFEQFLIIVAVLVIVFLIVIFVLILFFVIVFIVQRLVASRKLKLVNTSKANYM